MTKTVVITGIFLCFDDESSTFLGAVSSLQAGSGETIGIFAQRSFVVEHHELVRRRRQWQWPYLLQQNSCDNPLTNLRTQYKLWRISDGVTPATSQMHAFVGGQMTESYQYNITVGRYTFAVDFNRHVYYYNDEGKNGSLTLVLLAVKLDFYTDKRENTNVLDTVWWRGESDNSMGQNTEKNNNKHYNTVSARFAEMVL